MRITKNYTDKPILNVNYNKTNQISFTGLKTPLTKCIFVFDLDGTLAAGTGEEIQKIIEIAKQRTAKLIYATGRSKKEVEKLQQKLAEQQIILPTPEYLVSNNGQFLYENIDGVLVKNTNYETMLKQTTNFDSKKVFETMRNLAHSDEYKFSPQQLQSLEKLSEFNAIKEKDPEFYTSKISYYEWNVSEFMSEYFVAAGVDLAKLKLDIQKALAKNGIKTKFTEKLYPKKIMDVCNESILLQSHKLRRHDNGAMTALFLCPADKADGIQYLRKQLDVPSAEILIAGNDDNDVSMAQLAREGTHFICLNNASDTLKTFSTLLKNTFNNIFMAKNDGAKGILEGMSEIIKG